MEKRYIFWKMDQSNAATARKNIPMPSEDTALVVPDEIGDRVLSCIKTTREVVSLSWGLSFCERAYNELWCWCGDYSNTDPYVRTVARDEAEFIVRAFFHEFKACADHLDSVTNPNNSISRYIRRNPIRVPVTRKFS